MNFYFSIVITGEYRDIYNNNNVGHIYSTYNILKVIGWIGNVPSLATFNYGPWAGSRN
jgi:hypothetical protein